MEAKNLTELLEQLRDGKADVSTVEQKLKHLPFEDIGFAKVDHHRQLRRGMAEVIYCPNKTPEQVLEIFTKLAAHGSTVLATRADEKIFQKLLETGNFEGIQYEKAARTILYEQEKKDLTGTKIPIVTAGTADIPVAMEAKITAQAMGQPAELICDVGVAGIHRLFGQVEKLQKANVIIVVAGMEGALASVVGGLVNCPVIGVPTSVGYGASFGGISALLTMLNSCASGVTVVNIDNGFSAAVTASMINRKVDENNQGRD